LWVQYLQFPPLITVHKILSPQPQTMFSLVYFYILDPPLCNLCSFHWLHTQQHNNHFTTLCSGLPGWAGSRRNTHPPTSLIAQSLPASSSTTIHSILPVQITRLAIFLHNLSTSSSGALHLIIRTFLHPISVFFSMATAEQITT